MYPFATCNFYNARRTICLHAAYRTPEEKARRPRSTVAAHAQADAREPCEDVREPCEDARELARLLPLFRREYRSGA